MTQKENQLLRNIRKLVVSQQNTMASVMELMKLSQDTGHPVLNFIAKIKSAARQCKFKVRCKCDRVVDFTDNTTLYKLVTGVNDLKLQEDLLKVEDLPLTAIDQSLA